MTIARSISRPIARSVAASVTVGAPSGEPAEPSAPVNTVLPSISGTPTVGETLTADPGTWTGTATIVYTYQWLADEVEIEGATEATYELVEGDVGAEITVEVTGTTGVGSDTATSESVGPVAAAYGPELVTNPNFDTDVTGWGVLNSATLQWVAGGVCEVTIPGAGAAISQTVPTEAGKTYRVVVRAKTGTYTGTLRLRATIGSSHVNVPGDAMTITSEYTDFAFAFQCDVNTLISITRGTAATGTWFLDSLSMKEVLP